MPAQCMWPTSTRKWTRRMCWHTLRISVVRIPIFLWLLQGQHPCINPTFLMCGRLHCTDASCAQVALLHCSALMMQAIVGNYLIKEVCLSTASLLSVPCDFDTHVQVMSQSAACCLTTTAPLALHLWSLPSMRVPRTPWTAAGLSWAQCPSASRHPRHLSVMMPEGKPALNNIVSICDGYYLPGVCLQWQHSKQRAAILLLFASCSRRARLPGVVERCFSCWSLKHHLILQDFAKSFILFDGCLPKQQTRAVCSCSLSPQDEPCRNPVCFVEHADMGR